MVYCSVKEVVDYGIEIQMMHINNIERPMYLSRSKKSGTLHDVP